MMRTGSNRTLATAAALLASMVATEGCAPPASVGAAGGTAIPMATDSFTVAGVSLELARHRAATLSKVEYDLSLDLTGTASVPGEVTITVTRGGGAGDLIADFRGDSLHAVSVEGTSPVTFEWRNGHVVVPARFLRPGVNRIRFRFTSRMAAAGASVIRSGEPAPARGGATDSYVYTLLVPADANLLFPSLDQPDLKAVFRTTLTAPQGWRVLANGALLDTTAVAGGVRWRFAPTEPISTYLAAFAAGPWERWESAPPGRLPITLYARRSRAAEVDADTLIATNRRAVEWLERYFEVPFPFAKFDMLLAPAFPFGGMEHVGAIFYNESRFIFREPPTLNDRLGRNATIYHEVAHQWFGDLVTMRWFDDLWLKEGFSTYMAARMQEALNPGTGAWKTFFLRNKPLAYGVDATRGTTPVWQSLANLDLAKSAYGPIVYNKAPAILKQLELVVGEEGFRRGLQLLLRRHAYANITWRDLLAALEESSGKSLTSFGEHYILREGMPVIEPLLDVRDGRITRLRLAQRPARQIPGDRGGWWPGQVRVRLGYTDREHTVIPVAFTGDTTEVTAARGLPAPAWVFPNEGDYGYGTFLLDSASAAALTRGVGDLDDELLRAMVWVALWEQVSERRLPAASFVELALRELPGERDEQISSAILGRAVTALTRHLLDRDGPPPQLQRAMEEMLLARATDSALSYGLRKAALDALLDVTRTPAAQGTLVELLRGSRQFDGKPLGQPSRWSAIQTLLAVGHRAADSLLSAEALRDTTPESARRAFVAGAAIPTAANKAEYFRRFLDDTTLNEEWVTAALATFNHPDHAALTRQYLRPALDRLPWIQRNRRIFFLPQWIASFIGGHNSAEALAVVDEYLNDQRDLPDDIRRKVLQSRDPLERVVLVRSSR